MIVARGVRGELRVGYHVAAHLGRWALDLPADAMSERCRLIAELGDVDEFWIAQRPMRLRLQLGAHAWEWTDVGVAFDGRAVVTVPNISPIVH